MLALAGYDLEIERFPLAENRNRDLVAGRGEPQKGRKLAFVHKHLFPHLPEQVVLAHTRLLRRAARREIGDNEADARRQRGKLGGGYLIGFGNAESQPCLADRLFRDCNRRDVLSGTDRATEQCEQLEMDGRAHFRRC